MVAGRWCNVYTCDQLIPHFGSTKAAGDAFRRLRAASEKGGTGIPYFVAQIWPPMATADFLDAVGFDALGAYSAPGTTNSGEPYAKLVEMNQWYWNQYKATGREVVPLVNAGWDGRPRNYPGAWYEPAKPTEVADAVKCALDWNRANLNAARAGTVPFTPGMSMTKAAGFAPRSIRMAPPIPKGCRHWPQFCSQTVSRACDH